MTQNELREYCEQVVTAGILYKLLKAEGNVAAKALLQEVKAKSLGQHIHDINEERAMR